MRGTDQWATYQLASGVSQTTIDLRMRVLNALRRHAGVDDPLNLTPDQAEAFLARKMRPWSRLTYWRVLREWSRFLVDFGIDPTSDLVGRVKRPRTPADAPRPLTDEAIEKLLAAPLSPRPYAYVRLALFAALRVHEIAQVRGEDFDHAAGWLMVRGKGDILAPVPIHPEVSKLAEGRPEFGWWFPSPVDPTQQVTAVSVTQTVGAAIRSVGCTGTAHQLRHSAATRIQRQSKDIRLTQALLRHRSLITTQRYAAVSNDELQAAVRRLGWETTGESNVIPFRGRLA